MEDVMKIRIRKWGRSLGLPIPRSVAETAGIDEGTEVSVSVRDRVLHVTLPDRPRYRLSELLRGVTPENVHRQVDSGPAVGREAW
jgi:antitoxin MazE